MWRKIIQCKSGDNAILTQPNPNTLIMTVHRNRGVEKADGKKGGNIILEGEMIFPFHVIYRMEDRKVRKDLTTQVRNINKSFTSYILSIMKI